MSLFVVAPSYGSYRATLHPYKIFFQMKTNVQGCKSALISTYGLSLTSIADVYSDVVNADFLVGND